MRRTLTDIRMAQGILAHSHTHSLDGLRAILQGFLDISLWEVNALKISASDTDVT